MPLISLLVEWAQPKKESINLNITCIKLLLFFVFLQKNSLWEKILKVYIRQAKIINKELVITPLLQGKPG